VNPPLALALALAVLAPAAPPPADAEPAQPVEADFSAMVEDLQRLQTRIAEGDRAAYPAEVAELKTMAAAIAGAAPQTWASKREADALVVYVLSGGALAPVVPLVRDEALIASERALVRGALAYITNHEADALEALGPIDLEALDIRAAGPAAFARSVLRTPRDPKAAMLDLDFARLVAPGGLVEEAALRREIALLAEAQDAPRVALLARQYADRFAASLYAPDFFRDLARLIGGTGLADDPANYRLLSQAAAHLPADGRRDFLLTLAGAAALNGRFDAAVASAGEALGYAAPGSVEEARGRLYLDAGRIFSDAYEAGAADLRAIDASRLDRSDAELLATVCNVAAQLRAAPTAAAEAQADPAPDKGDGKLSTVSMGEEALRRTDSLVAEGGSGGP
jgi:chemotaxis protein MotC